MSAPNVGDRVRVEFEGEVWKRNADFATWCIRLDGMGNDVFDQQHPVYPTVYSEHCTIIAPPVKVGDLVTRENVAQLPEWSVISAPRCAARTKVAGRWISEGNDPASDSSAATFSAVVLRIGGGES